MHFPTTLPPASGSPAATLHLESPHPATFDGPLPPPPPPSAAFPRTNLPLIPPRPAARRPPAAAPSSSGGGAKMPYSSLATAKLKTSGSAPSAKLLEARNSWKRKRKARLEGAVKPGSPVHGGEGRPSGVVSVRSKNRLRKMFGIEQEQEEAGVPVEEFLQRKKKGAASSGARSGGSGGGGGAGGLYDKMVTGHKERQMAARASREQEREDYGKDGSGRWAGGERSKLSSHAKKLSLAELQDRYDTYRERKHSEKEAEVIRANSAPGETFKTAHHHHKEHHKFTDAARRGVKSAKAEIKAYKYTRREERDDSEEKTGDRIVNAMRTVKARFEDRDAEREAKRIANLRPKPRAVRPGARSRSYSVPHVPVFSSPSYTEPDPPYLEADGLQSPKALGPQTLNEPAERSRAYQQVFPARPSPSYRPTLSPVYSKSGVYASPVTTASSNKEGGAGSASTSTGVQNDMVTAPSFVDPPKSKSMSSSAPPIPERSEARLQGKVGDLSPLTSSTVKRERVLQSASEIANLRKKRSYGGHRRSLTTDDEIPPLELPPPEARPATARDSDHSRAIPPLQNSPAGPRRSPDPRGPHHHRHHHYAMHPNIDTSKTPTSSALEFWAAADASLAPSESASAQPANRRKGEPPPDIWRDADRTLNLRKGGPTMEEWIASLPGLGLRLGPWGDDEDLDARVLEDLRTKSPESSTMRGNEVLRAELVERIKDMDERAPEPVEELVPEDEEAEVSDDDDDDDQTEVVNAPPEVVDPTLLHPEYVPSTPRGAERALVMTKARMPGTAFADMDLAGDVTERLEALERYWDEQGMMVGTVLKRMLWIVDSIIVKEREDAQRMLRRMEMGWGEEEEEAEAEAVREGE